MPELQVDPQVLTAAARSVAAAQSAVAQVAAGIRPVLGEVEDALPGSRTATVAGHADDVLTAGARSLAADLAALAGTLSAAATEYAAVERVTAAGLERTGRRPT